MSSRKSSKKDTAAPSKIDEEDYIEEVVHTEHGDSVEVAIAHKPWTLFYKIQDFMLLVGKKKPWTLGRPTNSRTENTDCPYNVKQLGVKSARKI